MSINTHNSGQRLSVYKSNEYLMLCTIADEWCITKWAEDWKYKVCLLPSHQQNQSDHKDKREAAVFWDITGFKLVSMCKYVGGYKQRSTFKWRNGHSCCLAEDWQVIFWEWVNHNAHIETIIPFSMVHFTSTAFPLHSEVQNLVWMFLRWLPAHL